ncbi:MAG: hypothetical protein QOE14_1777 [Humisphaera sp.]|nr:hypothetical protein [Humisphaera sp.]
MTQAAAPSKPVNDVAAGTSRRSRIAQFFRHHRLLLALACVGLLLPFITKPLHMDDPMYVWAAEHIISHPLDPYGLSVNWRSTSTPMADEMKNPPLVCYYLAGAMLILGRSEPALHLAMMLPAVGVVLGTYQLAKELGGRPTIAALATLASPVFLISASTIMSDVAMLCSFVWVVWFWVRGMKTNRTWLLVVASLLIAASALTKYFGVALIPLLLADGLIRRRGRPGTWMLPLLVPVAILIAYQIATKRMYGHGLLFDAASYAGHTREAIGHPLAQRLMNGLSFVGGGCLTIALLLLVAIAAAARRGRRTIFAWMLTLAVVLVALLALDPYAPKHAIHRPDGGGIDVLLWVPLGVFITAGLAIFAAAINEIRRRRDDGSGESGGAVGGWSGSVFRDPDAILLLLWLLGTFVFATLVNWAVNGRSVLPAAPAAAIVAARMLSRITLTTRTSRAALVGMLLAGAALSFACVRGDATDAVIARRGAFGIHRRFPPPPGSDRRIYFSGHWGFQHYMQQRGARAIDAIVPDWRVGDLLVQPVETFYMVDYIPAAPDALPVIARLRDDSFPSIATMHAPAHGGFYSDGWGPLPYAFGRTMPTFFVIREIRGPIQPVWRRDLPRSGRTDTGPAARTPGTAD